MKKTLLLITILISALAVSGQIVYVPTTERCTKKVADLAVIRGLKMGMERDRFEMNLSSAYREGAGRDHETFYRNSFSNIELRELDHVDVEFYKDKLVDLQVTYNPVPFDGDAEFAKVVAEQFGLPNSWKSTMLGLGLQMQCSDFTIAVEKRSSSFRITDTKAAKAKEDAAKEEVERKKKEFKIT